MKIIYPDVHFKLDVLYALAYNVRRKEGIGNGEAGNGNQDRDAEGDAG